MPSFDDIAAAKSTDALTDLLATFCQQEGIPYESADELLWRVQDWHSWLQSFIDKWDETQAREDFESAIAARGE